MLKGRRERSRLVSLETCNNENSQTKGEKEGEVSLKIWCVTNNNSLAEKEKREGTGW